MNLALPAIYLLNSHKNQKNCTNDNQGKYKTTASKKEKNTLSSCSEKVDVNDRVLA